MTDSMFISQLDSKEKMPDNQIVWSIICTLFFSTILGVISFWYSSKVATYYMDGDYERSKDAAKKAKIWAIVGIVLSIVFGAIFLWILIIGLKDFDIEKTIGTEI